MAWSSALDTWGRIVIAVGGWFKRWWKWVIGGLAVAGAFLIGVILRPQGSAEDPAKKAREAAEAEAQRQREELQRLAALREKEVVAHADQVRVENVEEVKKDTALVADDPVKVNDYLHVTGDEMRKP